MLSKISSNERVKKKIDLLIQNIDNTIQLVIHINNMQKISVLYSQLS